MSRAVANSLMHGLTDLNIFNNITMLELRTTVTEWLTTAPEQETEGVIEQWAIQRRAASTHTGIFNNLLEFESNGETIAKAMVHHKVPYISVMKLCSLQSRTCTTARLPCTKGFLTSYHTPKHSV
jgi:hypothetical protein